MFPPKYMCWSLLSSVMVFGGGTFGRWLGHPHALYKRGPREIPHPLLLCEVTVGSHHTQNLSVFWSWNSQASNTVRSRFLLFISHPVCGILLWQPEWAKRVDVLDSVYVPTTFSWACLAPWPWLLAQCTVPTMVEGAASLVPKLEQTGLGWAL